MAASVLVVMRPAAQLVTPLPPGCEEWRILGHMESRCRTTGEARQFIVSFCEVLADHLGQELLLFFLDVALIGVCPQMHDNLQRPTLLACPTLLIPAASFEH